MAQRLSPCCPICYHICTVWICTCWLSDSKPSRPRHQPAPPWNSSLTLFWTVCLGYFTAHLLGSQPDSACHISWSTRDFPLLLLILLIIFCSNWVMSLNIITNYSWYPACCNLVLTQPVTKVLYTVTARKQGWEFLKVASYSKALKCAQVHIYDLQYLSVYCLCPPLNSESW